MSLARLQSIAASLERIAPLDAAWLRAAIEDIESGIPINDALGFSPSVQRARRDAAIRRAADLLSGSKHEKAVKLARWILWLEQDIEPPADGDESAIERALDTAQAAGLKLPKSARQIQRIL